MKTSTPKCPSSKPSLPTSPSPNHHQHPPEPTSHLIQHDLHGDDVEITLKKSGFLRTISSKLLRDFTELMYNLVYFSQHNNSPRHNEEDEDDEYSEYLMEDYSTFYTDYDQMATFAAPLNRQPSVPLKKTTNLNETKSTSVPSFQSIELSKRDSNVQTDDSSLMKLSSKSSRSSKSSKEDSRLDVSQTSSDDASFFYRLKESAPKKGIVKETRVRKVFAPDNHKRHDQILYHHSDYSDGNHLSESMRSSRSSNRELVPKQREIRPSPWKELLDPDHANSLLKLIFNMLIGAVIILVVYSGVMALRDDFMRKREQENSIVLVEMQQCLRDYNENGCDPVTRRPALESYCVMKEKCFSQDPTMVVKASKMTASLLAETLNEFVEPLGLKTMVFFFCLFFGMILICNCSLRGDSRRLQVRRNGEIEEINVRLQRVERLNVEKQVICGEPKDAKKQYEIICNKKYR